MRYRITLHQPREEAIRGTERDSLNVNTMLQMALKDDVERWPKPKGMGIRLGDYESDCLTSLRFAGDVLLFSVSLVQLQKMMCDFKQSVESVGLKIHPDKTKILSNQSINKRKEVEINNIKVEILSACESAKYLGQTSAVQHQETAETKNRIRGAWASFHRYRPELTSRSYSLQHRLRLFNMVSYASGTWTLSKEHERMIRSTQRKVLRFFVQTKRRKLSPAAGTSEMKKMKKQTTEAQMKKLQREAVQTQITTKTATFPS